MNEDIHAAENIRKLGDLIKGIKFAMMTTIDEDGMLHSRPMAAQEQDFDGELWFFTGRNSHKVDELHRNRQINLSFGEPDKNRFISISGTGEVVIDRKKAESLWNPFYKAWFPKGLNDPDLVLLKVIPEQAEYWDSPSGKIVQLVGFIKAIATGRRADNVGEHERFH